VTRSASEIPIDTATEWLEADGLGGFASGTTSGIRTRRYHALLLAAAHPPSDRFVLVNGFVAWLETEQGREELTLQHYAPNVTTEPAARIVRFSPEPWPTWELVTQSGVELTQEIVVERGEPSVLLRFSSRSRAPALGALRLLVRPLLSGRDFHHLQRENAAFDFTPALDESAVSFAPYASVPATHMRSNGKYRHAPDWYRNFRYGEEHARGLDCDEDLAAPGEFCFDLGAGPALWLLSAGTAERAPRNFASLEVEALALMERERTRRATFARPLLRAAEAYVVERGEGRTIIAGYPWFSDWGRDTFIALRGLCIATGRLHDARRILLEWAEAVSEGMLPNRFSDRSDERAEFNSVDASLWYVVAARQFIDRAFSKGLLTGDERRVIERAMTRIVLGYARGTRYGIRRDSDGLLRAGAPGIQLTWMDAKIGDYVVTPRCGKPVEVQALWLNALHATLALAPESAAWLAVGRESFRKRFWNGARGALYDVVDVDHIAAEVDGSLRPNQIFAAGGLPYCLLEPNEARAVVDVVERALWTPLGLRSLAPTEPGYRSRYEGGVWSRDTAYHQGTVWPWLLGAFVEAWVKTRGGTREAKREATQRFVEPLEKHLYRAGLGHVSEIADAEAPFEARGCPFQAWSTAELLRLELEVLAD
jgi:predicted glycogen debranching enzyme